MAWSAIASKLTGAASKLGMKMKQKASSTAAKLYDMSQQPQGRSMLQDMFGKFESVGDRVSNLEKKHGPFATPQQQEQHQEKLAGARRERSETLGRIFPQMGATLGIGQQDQSQSQRLGNVVGSGLNAVGDAAMVAGGPVGLTIGAVTKLGAGLAKSVEKLRDWNEGLHKANMAFAEFSGQMTTVQVEQQIRDMQLSRERGDRRADSARFLAESKSSLDRKFSVYEDAFAKVSNYTAGALSKITESVLTNAERGSFGPGIGLGLQAFKWFGSMGSEQETDLDKWMKASDETNWAAEYGRPRRFQGE